MKLSQIGMGTTRLQNIDEQFPVQDILVQSGQLVQYGSGIYGYQNVPFLVQENIKKIIVEELNKVGCTQIILPTLQPRDLWEKSNRWSNYVDAGVMLTIETDKGDFCVAPTAEEAVVEFATTKVKSYKDLPVTLYQISEKFRNELRARGFLLRGKCFLMMDAYSFDTDVDGLVKSYENIKEAYLKIFERLGLKAIPVVADNGDMGGKKSEEFMYLSELGEDTILYDEETGIGLNIEILEKENYEQYLEEEYGIKDISKLQKKRAIELGHIFQLGERYSETMNASFTDKDGKEKPFVMGCYGIGVSRVLATVYEANLVKNKKGLPAGSSLPKEIAPYPLHIIYKEDKKDMAGELYDYLEKHGIEAIIDDREGISLGARIGDCNILGTPYLTVLGDQADKDSITVEATKNGEKFTLSREKLIEFLK
ncbi:MAG: hypothetical protein IKG56_03090 [Clostridia bacterium]|nr:hypothetical protein [Clostridia bacterium]